MLSKFDTAGGVIRSHPTPVPATPEIVLCIATGAGLVAVLSRSLWAWQEDRHGGGAVALLPTFGLFCYTALLSSQIDRLPGVVTYVVAALGFVIAADRATSVGAPSHDPAGTPSTGRRLMAGVVASMPAVLVGTLAVVVPVGRQPGPGDAQGGRPALPDHTGSQGGRCGLRQRHRRPRGGRTVAPATPWGPPGCAPSTSSTI